MFYGDFAMPLTFEQEKMYLELGMTVKHIEENDGRKLTFQAFHNIAVMNAI